MKILIIYCPILIHTLIYVNDKQWMKFQMRAVDKI